MLKRMLDREQLFLTDVGKSACEAAARANMSHEWRLAFGGQLLTHSTLGGWSGRGLDSPSSCSGCHRLFDGLLVC